MPQDQERQISLEDFEESRRKYYGIPSGLAASLRQQESGGRQYDPETGGALTSPKQAKGRYQVLQSTADRYGLNAGDPFENVEASFRYLSDLNKQVDKSVTDPGERWAQTLAGYHAGEGKLRRMNKTGSLPTTSDGLITTDKYVSSVMNRWQRYDQERSAAEASQPAQAEPTNAAPLSTARRLGLKPGDWPEGKILRTSTGEFIEPAQQSQFTPLRSLRPGASRDEIRSLRPSYPNPGTGDLVPPSPPRPLTPREKKLADDENARIKATLEIARLVEDFEALKREGSARAARSVAGQIKRRFGQWMEVGEGDGWPYVKSKVAGWNPVQPTAPATTPSLEDRQAAFARLPLSTRIYERTADAYARGGGQLSRMARQALGAGAGAARKIVNPQAPFEVEDFPSWRAGEEARLRELEERRQARPSSFATEVGEGIIEGVPAAAAAIGGGVLTGGGVPAMMAIGGGMGAAGADWSDPKRAAAQTAIGAVAPIVGGRIGSKIGETVASRLSSPAAQFATRAGGELTGGGLGFAGATGAEELAFEGQVQPRELAKSFLVGAGLAAPNLPMMARGAREVSPSSAADPAIIEQAAQAPDRAPITVTRRGQDGRAVFGSTPEETSLRAAERSGDAGLRILQDYTTQVAEIERTAPEGPERRAAIEAARAEYLARRRGALAPEAQSNLARARPEDVPTEPPPAESSLSTGDIRDYFERLGIGSREIARESTGQTRGLLYDADIRTGRETPMSEEAADHAYLLRYSLRDGDILEGVDGRRWIKDGDALTPQDGGAAVSLYPSDYDTLIQTLNTIARSRVLRASSPEAPETQRIPAMAPYTVEDAPTAELPRLAAVEDAPSAPALGVRDQPLSATVSGPRLGEAELSVGAPAAKGGESPSLGKAIGNALRTGSQAMRTLWTSLDLSAPLSQGAVLSIAHPFKSAISFGKMFRSLSKSQSAAIDAEIANHPLLGLGEDFGLYVATSGKAKGAPEEFYSVEALNKLPGISHSERTFRTYLDTLRLSTWESYVKSLQRAGFTPENNPTAYRQAAEFINIATGRGSLKPGGKLAKAMDLGGGILFAPRNLVANFQLLDPVRYATLAPGARKVVLRDAMTAFGSMLGTAALLRAAGVQVGFDPEENDFMTARWGNHRYDLTFGKKTQVQFLARVMAGTYRQVTGEGNLPYKDPLSVSERFIRGKLAPIYSTAYTFASGRDFTGEPIKDKSKWKLAWETAAPLLWRDLAEAYHEEGIPGVVKSSPAIFGARVSTYPDKPKTDWLKVNAEARAEQRRLGLDRAYLEPRKGESVEQYRARKAATDNRFVGASADLVSSPGFRNLDDDTKREAFTVLREAVGRGERGDVIVENVIARAMERLRKRREREATKTP